MHQRRHYIFGHRVGVASRQIGHCDAARSGGSDRDEIKTDAVPDHALQPRRMIYNIIGQLGANDDAVGILGPLAQGFRPCVGRHNHFDMRR